MPEQERRSHGFQVILEEARRRGDPNLLHNLKAGKWPVLKKGLRLQKSVERRKRQLPWLSWLHRRRELRRCGQRRGQAKQGVEERMPSKTFLSNWLHRRRELRRCGQRRGQAK